ncbi:MAG: YqeG family HAD IIIA-type phosphatase [Alkalinema sp. RU_4_3]|nr:YqeG family HAD IIIA-type phosphatase [Alkalinema sp. RU_4_3]
MTWGNLLQPDLWLNKTTTHLTPKLLNDAGLKGLVLDVDETLVPRTIKQLSDEIVPWFQSIQAVTPQIWLVSNNPSIPRIQRIAEVLNVPYIARAGKPSRTQLRRAIESMELPPEQVGMVGDRLFTDVLAGNRLGMYTILVEPMRHPKKQGGSLVHRAEFWLSRALGAKLDPHQS